MKIKKSTRYTLAGIILLLMIGIISSLVLRYHVKPGEVFYLDKTNLIEDGSFENFNETVGDCCTTPENAREAKISAFKSIDAKDKYYSLNLTSSNHCACINKKVLDFDNSLTYLFSFYYKGDNPKICNWVSGDNACLPVKQYEKTANWSKYGSITKFTNKSTSAFIYIYSNSDGTKTVTNLYDDIEFHQLIQMDLSYNFKDNERYVIKTDPSNIVHNGEPLNDVGYYLVTGKPDITIRFPWPELIILLFMMLIVIRLLFKKHPEQIK